MLPAPPQDLIPRKRRFREVASASNTAYKGISHLPSSDKWRAQICYLGKVSIHTHIPKATCDTLLPLLVQAWSRLSLLIRIKVV